MPKFAVKCVYKKPSPCILESSSLVFFQYFEQQQPGLWLLFLWDSVVNRKDEFNKLETWELEQISLYLCQYIAPFMLNSDNPLWA